MHGIIFAAAAAADVLLWFLLGPAYGAYGAGRVTDGLIVTQLVLTLALVAWCAVAAFRWHRRFHARVIEEAIRMRGVR